MLEVILIGTRPPRSSGAPEAENRSAPLDRIARPRWLHAPYRAAGGTEASLGPRGLQDLVQIRGPQARWPSRFAQLPPLHVASPVNPLESPGNHAAPLCQPQELRSRDSATGAEAASPGLSDTSQKPVTAIGGTEGAPY